ncbi:hypothetical protein HMPREF0645_2534 [Hallella bergensis DSM 17361]|uniref:DUF4376 domain-containing protein n=1 Tax=Hallella bergensis DSM 17361 TaxID=585502 RepID=D1PZZ9_9BACT|nr:DUF4376 domain-containing protein [Hallella bergensis]EFA43041.1 hypothetical protein HMPREF0645_2534 [Hallella bergensis DSM 17361]
MKKEEINGCTVLEADAGKKIVKDNFVCGTVVWLAVGDATDAYKEVSVEEADAMEKAQREIEGGKPDEETPVETPSDIDMAKAAKIAEIAAYSDSDAVNSLTFNGIKTWLTRTVRDGYDTSITAAKNLGETNVTFMVGDNEMQLPVEQARRVLDLVQRYADACFIVTERHKIAVKALQTVEEVEAYDYTVGYPEKLAL